METLWIIGAGHFGGLAVERLSKKKGERNLVVVDPHAEALAELEDAHGITPYQGDGIEFLARELTPQARVDWIIPSLPLHMAWEWCQRKLGTDQLVQAPMAQGLLQGLPNAMEGRAGDIYASHADFICPDNCPEPDQICTATGRPRKQDMFALIADLSTPDCPSLVLRSRQLCPGVGGVTPAQLHGLLSEIRTRNGPLMISTACRCHAVVTPSRHTP